MAKGFGVSPLTNTIYYGTQDPAKHMWTGKKEDVTDGAIAAVYEGDKFIASYYKEHCQHGDVYSINNDGTVGEKIGVCSILIGEIKK